MKIQILSRNYCAFAIQNNRCCLTAQRHKAFLRGLNSNFLILRYAFCRALKRVSKSGVNSFSKKTDLRLYRTQPTIYVFYQNMRKYNPRFLYKNNFFHVLQNIAYFEY
jgi:hypothetical protein